MPELPEVEVVRLGVDPVVRGATLDAIRVIDVRSLKRHRGPPEDFIERLEGATIEGALRRGKFMWFPLRGTDQALVCHLGMSGQVLLGSQSSDFGPHLRIRLEGEDAMGAPFVLGFVDQRIFGSMAVDDLVETGETQPAGFGGTDSRIPRSVAHIARDPLDQAFDDQRFSQKLRAKNTEIKRALLDQVLISGIGNIYADEALWAARLHYRYPTSRMTPMRTRGLLDEVRTVLRRALAEGGTSFDAQYVNVNGASGYFSHSLAAYGQDGKPCPRCATIIRREPFMNRSSHRCPSCQRTPRTR